MKTNQNFINSFKSNLTSHFVGAKFSKITMAKDICTLATSQSIGSFRKVGKVLKVDMRNIRKVDERKQLLDSFGVAFWTSHQHVKRSNILSELTKNLMTSWWNTKTTILPNYKDVTQRQIGVKIFEEHATHYLQISQVFPLLHELVQNLCLLKNHVSINLCFLS